VTSPIDLARGVSVMDKTGRQILYRNVQPHDDIDVITDMLHEAYAPLAAQGLRFLATHQDSTITRERMSRGETIIALDERLIVGTITLKDVASTSGSPFYDRADVAGFGQYAVRSSHQGCGIGSVLLSLVEMRAREKGATLLALDTSEHAAHLIALYRAKGFEVVEHVKWLDVNYRSVIMAKSLRGNPSIPR
jgi:GNAT superfamily N-acetyltransferase